MIRIVTSERDKSSGSSVEQATRAAAPLLGRVVPPEQPFRPPEIYRRIVETTHEGIWMADLQGTTTFINPQMARMLGCEPAAAIGKPVFDYVFEEDRATVKKHFELFLKAEEGQEVEERLRRADGTEFWALAAASVFHHSDGTPAGFLGMFTDITTRKAAESALQRSETRLRLQVARMPIGHILWDCDFRVMSWNPAAEAMFGYRASEAIGKHACELIVPPEVRAHVDAIWKRLLRGDTSAHSENANRTKSGDTIVCEWSNTPLREPNGTIIGVLSMVQDITHRRRTEQALQQAMETLEQRVTERTAELNASNAALAESEERHRRLFETVSDAVVVFDGNSRRFLDVNEAAVRLYGYGREEFLQMEFPAITAEPEQSETSIRLCLAGVAPRIPLRYHKKRDGTIFPVEISASSFVFRGQKTVCGIIRDITSRKLAEAELRRREQELADFFAEAPLGLLWLSDTGRVLRINQAGIELFGAAGDDVFDQDVRKFFIDPKAGTVLLQQLNRGETVHSFRARIRSQNQTVREVLIDANGLWIGSKLIHSRCFVRDITHKVELEREVLGVTERQQMRFGQDLHDDLSQQLAGIEFLCQGLIQQLKQKEPGIARRASEIAGMVQHAMVRTRELAHGIAPVRLEADGLADSLHELATRTRKIFRRQCRFSASGPVLIPDRQVALNLYRIAQEAVSNSVKHGHASSIRITLSPDKTGLTLSISDNGLGICAAAARDTRGMGLRTMAWRAELMGGTLEVRERSRGGTVVKCKLPEVMSTAGQGGLNEER